MPHVASILVGLLAVIAVVVPVAKRLHVPGPILLVPAGLALALIPGVPHVRLDPHLVLTLLLPPLVYAAAVDTSWPDFRRGLRPIALLAVGGVLLTTAAVAVVAHHMIGVSWAVAAVLGAVVSPPDTVAATAIAAQMSIPRRLATILQGEGLVNDATALVVYRFAVAAAVYGTFSAWHAGLTFAAVVVGETAWGVFVGWGLLWVRRWADDDRAEITLSLLAPFVAYLPAEHLGGSGVLATAAAGLWVGWNGWAVVAPTTRLAGRFFWDLIVFLIEGLLFLLTGLQFRDIRRGLSAQTWAELLGYAAVVCATVIAVRFVWVFACTYVPRWLASAGRRPPATPAWSHPFVVALAGMRGAVSLAAALAVPEVLATTGHPRFADRTLVIFLTFGVIVVTLVGQGLLLPVVIRRLGLDAEGRAERDETDRRGWDARIEAARAALSHLDELSKDGDRYPPEVIAALRRRHEARVRHLSHHRADDDPRGEQTDAAERHLLAAARRRLYELRRAGDVDVDDDASRQIEHELDLEDARLI